MYTVLFFWRSLSLLLMSKYLMLLLWNTTDNVVFIQNLTCGLLSQTVKGFPPGSQHDMYCSSKPLPELILQQKWNKFNISSFFLLPQKNCNKKRQKKESTYCGPEQECVCVPQRGVCAGNLHAPLR